MNQMHVKVTKSNIDEYQTNGVIMFRNIFTPWVNGIREAIEQNKCNPSWRERTYRSDDAGESEFFQDYCVWSKFAGYRSIVECSPMAQIAADLMCSKVARIFHDHILVKEPGNSVVTPWHHDQPYYFVEGSQCVSFWIPVDRIPKERSIEYVVGSHLWAKNYTPKRFDGTDLYANDQNKGIPDIDADRTAFDIRSWAVEPGDAIAFNFRTLHSAPANYSSSRRRVTSIRWVGDDARFVNRPGRTSPDFPDLEYEDDSPFEGEEFPIVFTR